LHKRFKDVDRKIFVKALLKLAVEKTERNTGKNLSVGRHFVCIQFNTIILIRTKPAEILKGN